MPTLVLVKDKRACRGSTAARARRGSRRCSSAHLAPSPPPPESGRPARSRRTGDGPSRAVSPRGGSACRSLRSASLALGAVIALLGVGSYAIAGGGTKHFSGDPLNGYEENPDVSTVADGAVRGASSPSDGSDRTTSSATGLEGPCRRRTSTSRKRRVNGGIVVLPLHEPRHRPASTPDVPDAVRRRSSGDDRGGRRDGPTAGTVAARARASAPSELARDRRGDARPGATYANVHSTTWPRRRDPRPAQRRGRDGSG